MEEDVFSFCFPQVGDGQKFVTGCRWVRARRPAKNPQHFLYIALLPGYPRLEVGVHLSQKNSPSVTENSSGVRDAGKSAESSVNTHPHVRLLLGSTRVAPTRTPFEETTGTKSWQEE